MNYASLINELGLATKQLDEKKQQTDYKIKYIVEYIRLWILVNVNRPEITHLNFVDCMCNAGIYKDGDLCTSMEVLMLFMDAANLHPDKRFNLFINDNDESRTSSCSQIAQRLLATHSPSNINIFVNTSDVNDYLKNFSLFDSYFKYGGATVVFVDPYDFGTVIISKLTGFISRYYCEAIFNFFISDYVRNGIDERIRNCIGDTEIANKEELIAYIRNSLKVGKIKHVFSYQFKTSKNTELYQIIFATPHTKGLEVLKEGLWKTFNGRFFHKNAVANGSGCEQLSLFTVKDERNDLLQTHADTAMELLLQNFADQTVAYKEIELFLIENTMMQTSGFLNYVLKPLIERGWVEKSGIPRNKSNFKDDEYTFIKKVQ